MIGGFKDSGGFAHRVSKVAGKLLKWKVQEDILEVFMKEKLEKISDFEWRLPKSVRKEMRVDAKIIANRKILEAIEEDAVKQLTNVACLPGVVEPVVGLPDMHWGYGLPMGAVSAFDEEEGIISAGLCGFDINCGINLIRTNLRVEDLEGKKERLIEELFRKIPVGVGARGKLRLSPSELDEVLVKGLDWAIEKGYATKEDKEATEEKGRMDGADPSKVSDMAKKRGGPQLGTLGAGNHFLEVQYVDEIFDEGIAKTFGLHKGQITVMVHCGSRGAGHQICTDYLKVMERASRRYGIKLPDPQLVSAPIESEEGKAYFGAMCAAANYAWANRHCIMQWTRETFAQVLGMSMRDMGLELVYDVAHNIVKLEEHKVDGELRQLCLLYTSPSPRDLSTSRMPSSA